MAFSSALDAPSVSRSASSMSDDLPAAGRRPAGRKLDDCPHLPDRDGQPLRHDRSHVGVGTGQDGVAGPAPSASAEIALQGGREGPGRDGSAGTGRAGEQPGVGHRSGRRDPSSTPAGGDRGPADLHRLRLAHDVGEHIGFRDCLMHDFLLI